ncbi:MAG TPA: adenylate/guanylate cyclase domain-containing protein [Myxococcota bacterium]|nr:adenylate/guanylate cyclase domain-containing protein [Myxococcota bacterium]HRY92625.1 adenylate/guanylate cyclase domain-containing protein [Myxococcota bacterium]HSA23497.1 adenylate/guanylate cyclase domain-containing protein [Myxococcota bacterium]
MTIEESENSKRSGLPLPRPGQRLGRFEVRKRLGVCALGAELLAEDPWTGEEVALQVLRPGLAQGEPFDAVGQEVALARRLAHPGVRRVFDLHEGGGLRFLALEPAGGPSLAELLQQAGEASLPLPRAAALVRAAAEAVAAAHAQGVLHGALRPEAIFVRAGDRVAIEGFGRGAQADSLYTAPEVLAGGQAEPASDQYALGAILYRCLTGRAPLEALGAVREGSGVRVGRPELPSRFNRLVTRSLETAVMTALAPMPQHRHRSVEGLALALGALEAELSARARRPRRGQASEPELAVPAASGPPLPDGASVRRATILFSDIVGITTFFETHGDLAGKARIERHNELLFPVIRRHQGTVLKTIGDAIMASFGDEDEAVEAAIQMQQALQGHNRAVVAPVDELHIRIGINSGEAIEEYGDAYGDAVNVASRVSGKAEGDQILLAEETRRALTRNLELVQPHSRAVLKGKRDVFQLYQVDWARAQDRGQEPDVLDLSGDETGEAPRLEPTAVLPAASLAERPVVKELTAAARRLQEGARPGVERALGSLGVRRSPGTVALLVGLVALVVVLGLALVASRCG